MFHYQCIDGSKGRARRTPIHRPPPPTHTQGSRFFRFDIQNFQNVTTSGVGAPLRGRRPLWEILDPPLQCAPLHFLILRRFRLALRAFIMTIVFFIAIACLGS